MHSRFVRDNRRRCEIKPRNPSESHPISVLIFKNEISARSLRGKYLKPGVRQVGTESALRVDERRRGDLPPQVREALFSFCFQRARGRFRLSRPPARQAERRSGAPPSFAAALCLPPSPRGAYGTLSTSLFPPVVAVLFSVLFSVRCDVHATPRAGRAGTFVHACAEGFTRLAAWFWTHGHASARCERGQNKPPPTCASVNSARRGPLRDRSDGVESSARCDFLAR